MRVSAVFQWLMIGSRGGLLCEKGNFLTAKQLQGRLFHAVDLVTREITTPRESVYVMKKAEKSMFIFLQRIRV